MNPLRLTWTILSIKANLPSELIIKILFNFGGIRHPIANLLLEETKIETYESLQKLSISKSIYKFYLNQEKYKQLFNIDFISFINNKQCSYFRECKSYI